MRAAGASAINHPLAGRSLTKRKRSSSNLPAKTLSSRENSQLVSFPMFPRSSQMDGFLQRNVPEEWASKPPAFSYLVVTVCLHADLFNDEDDGLRIVPRPVRSKVLMIPAVDSEPAAPVAHAADRPLSVDLILHLNGGVLGSSHIGSEGNEQLAGNSFLHGDSSTRLLNSVVTVLGVDR